MATFAFETITAAEAAAFNAAVDDLQFQTPGGFASMSRARYVAAGDGTPEMVAISFNGATVMFGTGVYGDQDIRFQDGTKLFVGGTEAESSIGTAGADALFGGQGTDTLTGGGGADLLQGNQGSDSIIAAEGDDFVFGGQGDDALAVGDGANFAQGNLGNDVIVATPGSGRNTLLGGQGDDAIVGGNAGDLLTGNLGADTITGGTGADTLAGEGGADVFNPGGGADVFVLTAGSSTATQAGADRILGWSAQDRFDVPGAGGAAAFYLTPSSGGGFYGGGGGGVVSFTTALARADNWMRDHQAVTVVSAQIADGVAIFIDTNGDHASDLSVILVGTGLFEFGAANVI